MNEIKIKFVNKANMWCKTTLDNKGTQKQKWFSTKKKANEQTQKKF